MLEKQLKNISYSQQLDDVCLKNSFSRWQLEKVCCRKDHLPPNRKLNLDELLICDSTPDIYKKLVVFLRKYNDNITKKDRIITPSEQAACQFVFESLRTFSFESKEAQKLNLEALDEWFMKTMSVRKKEPQPTPLKIKPNTNEDKPVISMQTSMRIKQYSRRHLEVHTGIMRPAKKQSQQQKQNERYNTSLNRLSNQLFMTNVKEFREKQEVAEICQRVQMFYKQKQKLSQNLLNKEYMKPDCQDDNQRIWGSCNLMSMHSQKFTNRIKSSNYNAINNFKILKEGNLMEQNPSEEIEMIESPRLNTTTEGYKRHKFTPLDRKSSNDSLFKEASGARVRTAEPGRFRRQFSKVRDLDIRDVNQGLSEAEYLKSKLESSKTNISNQMLFKGLNEPELSSKGEMILPESGFSLLVNPFFDQKKRKKRVSRKK